MTTENNSDYLILKYFFVIGVIVTLLHCIVKYISKVIERQFTGGNMLLLNSSSLNPDTLVYESIEIQLSEVKKLAEKISVEKQQLECVRIETLDKNCLADCQKIYSGFRERIRHYLEVENNKNQARCDEIQEILAKFKKEISGLRDEMDGLVKDWQSFENISTLAQSKCLKLLSESAVQTDETYSCTNICDKISECEISEKALLSLKNCVINIAEESGKAWMDGIIESFQTLEEKYNSNKTLIVSCWAQVSGESSNCDVILDEVQKIEKTVFRVLIFLQQHSIDSQTIRETLTFFDHKFEKMLKKSDARWNKSCSNLDYAFDCVFKAQKLLSEHSSQLSDSSVDVTRQMMVLEVLVKEFSGTAKLINNAEYLTSSVEKNICSLISNTAKMAEKVNLDYGQRLSKLTEVLLKPGKKLYMLCKAAENMHPFTESLKYIPSIPRTLSSPRRLPNYTDSNNISSDVHTQLKDVAKNFANIIVNCEDNMEKSKQLKKAFKFKSPLSKNTTKDTQSVIPKYHIDQNVQHNLSNRRFFQNTLENGIIEEVPVVSFDAMNQCLSNSSSESSCYEE